MGEDSLDEIRKSEYVISRKFMLIMQFVSIFFSGVLLATVLGEFLFMWVVRSDVKENREYIYAAEKALTRLEERVENGSEKN